MSEIKYIFFGLISKFEMNILIKTYGIADLTRLIFNNKQIILSFFH